MQCSAGIPLDRHEDARKVGREVSVREWPENAPKTYSAGLQKGFLSNGLSKWPAKHQWIRYNIFGKRFLVDNRLDSTDLYTGSVVLTTFCFSWSLPSLVCSPNCSAESVRSSRGLQGSLADEVTVALCETPHISKPTGRVSWASAFINPQTRLRFIFGF